MMAVVQTTRILVLGLSLGLVPCAFAQTEASAPPPQATEPLTAAPAGPEAGPRWNTLSPAQKTALNPLADAWPTLSSGHKTKWLTLVQKFPEMSDADKSRLNSRMVDWAALSPKDRELARLNFATTKKLSSDARMANWEAYQALPESKKQELLNAAPKKPVGAAVVVKPAPVNKLADVAVTRKTPEPVRAAVNQQQLVNRYTLLPEKQSSKDCVQAPSAY